MIKPRYLTLVVLLLVVVPLFLGGQIKVDYSHYRDLYNEGEYQRLFNEALALRQQPYGKNWKTDYFISKALCAGGNSDCARKAFDYTLSAYKTSMTNSQFDFLLSERDVCLTSASTAKIPAELIANFIRVIDNEHTSIRGKMGYILNCIEDPRAFEIDSNFNPEGLQERLFELDDTLAAVNYYRSLAGSGYSVKAGGRFIFITPSSGSGSGSAVKETTRKLENAYNFYADFFGLRRPDKLIAVYLMNDPANLRTIAAKVHGLRLPEKNIGYSCLADLSLLGTSSYESVGTIKHELFHLMVRTDVGDIPGWLDEGIACLYETSSWTAGGLKGEVNQWRTQVLKNMMVPSLKSMVEDNRDEFAVTPGKNACDISLNYALVKHFMIFLQEKGMLKQVIQAFKNRMNVMVDTTAENETDLQVLEKAFSKDIASIQSDFDGWLYSTYNLVPDRSGKYAQKLIGMTGYCRDIEEYDRQKAAMQPEFVKADTGVLPDELIGRLNSFIMKTRASCY